MLARLVGSPKPKSPNSTTESKLYKRVHFAHVKLLELFGQVTKPKKRAANAYPSYILTLLLANKI